VLVLVYIYTIIVVFKNPIRQTKKLSVTFFLYTLVALSAEVLYSKDFNIIAFRILLVMETILFALGHWLFAFRYYLSSVDVQEILAVGTVTHLNKPCPYRRCIEWSVSIFLVIFYSGISMAWFLSADERKTKWWGTNLEDAYLVELS
jgi:hypothetical protein